MISHFPHESPLVSGFTFEENDAEENGRAYIYVYMCVCVCICIYIYVYVYVYICICIYIYVCIYVGRPVAGRVRVNPLIGEAQWPAARDLAASRRGSEALPEKNRKKCNK